MMLLALLGAAALLASDTTRYVVLNHGRPAGEMIVARNADSVALHYHHVDRNRGPHYENRYRLSPTGDVIGAEARLLPLFQEISTSPPFDRFEIVADSVRRMG